MRLNWLAPLTLILGAALPAAGLAKADSPPAQSEGGESADGIATGVAALGWREGRQPVTERAAIQLPPGYRYLDPAETNKFLKFTGNLPEPESYTVAPDDLSWFAILAFDELGYVKDDEAIDPDALIKTMRENQERGNEQRKTEGLSPLTVSGWAVTPHYDRASHNLEYGLKLATPEGSNVNYSTRLLGRRGVMTATLISDTAGLDANVARFRTVLKGFDYIPDERYAAYKDGDKVSEYGLAALVTGGAAAAVLKAGGIKGFLLLLAAFGKYIVIGLVAGAAAFRGFFARLFRRGGDAEPPAM